MVLLLVGSLIWVLMTIMNAGDESEVTAKALKYVTPINPNLDVAVFAIVESKRLFTEAELELFPINQLIKDKSGNYTVLPFDAPKELVMEIKTGNKPKIAPTAPAVPSPPATPTATARTATNSGAVTQ